MSAISDRALVSSPFTFDAIRYLSFQGSNNNIRTSHESIKMVKPRLIILIRHAQSEGNKDRQIHQMVPDHRVKLTDEGHKQVRYTWYPVLRGI